VKYFLLVTAIVLMEFDLLAQIGIGNNNPAISSILDITSKEKGVLMPRMTMAQRDSINSPATGLLIYQTTNTTSVFPGFYYYGGSRWLQMRAWLERIPHPSNNYSGYRLFNNFPASAYGPIGSNAVDFSINSIPGDFGATGNASFATGQHNRATGNVASVVGGQNNRSTGEYSFIGGGEYNVATGAYSFVGCGENNRPRGSRSASFGYGSISRSASEFTIGNYNTDYVPNDSIFFHYDDRIFCIGNGLSETQRSNALVVLKNGKMEVAGDVNLRSGATTPGVGLRISGLEALWSDGNYFSWGYGAQFNYFNKPISINSTATPGFDLVVNGSAAKTGGGTWDNISDSRLKNIIGSYDKGLDEILKLNTYTFTYTEDNPYKLDAKKEQIGFIAQEVQKVIPEAVQQLNDGYLSFNMHAVNVAMVNAIKSLKQDNDDLRSELDDLKRKINTLLTSTAQITK
jgi:hypothetical protein